MKKVIVVAAVVAGILTLIRRFGPRLGALAMQKCEEMLDRMPEDFPPKRMMHGIDDIREQNVEILRRLHEQREASVI